MTVRELIEELSHYDPNDPVCCDNQEIYTTERTEAYWDGRLQRIVVDPEKHGKCYSIIGAEVVSRGRKVSLIPVGVEDVLLHDPEAPVAIDAGNADSNAEWEKRIVSWRAESREILARLERGEG